MSDGSSVHASVNQRDNRALSPTPWHSFADILQRLHRDRIYVHPHQLAEFLLMHGLPVDLRYVPERLQMKAQRINANYRGDLARLETTPEEHQSFWFE